MKKYFLNILLGISLLAVGLTSCTKDKVEPEKTPTLAKITSWNPSTGVENTSLEMVYNANGVATKAIYGGTDYALTYNAANKLSVLTATYKQGAVTVTHTLEYNTANQLVKIVFNDNGTNNNTKTLTYNAAGKIIKSSTVYASTGTTTYEVDYTWNGDNLATATTGTYTSTYVTYDDKLNPFSLADGISMVLYGNPPSKNNFTQLKTVNGGYTSTQNRVYEYNSSGWATSMKLTDGSNEGTKFYYNK